MAIYGYTVRNFLRDAQKNLELFKDLYQIQYGADPVQDYFDRDLSKKISPEIFDLNKSLWPESFSQNSMSQRICFSVGVLVALTSRAMHTLTLYVVEWIMKYAL